MKKLIFHIALSVALFCVLTVIFIGYGKEKLPFYQVDKSDGNGITLTEGEDYQCVGVPIEIIEKPKNVRAGDTVFLTFKGESYTDYEIRVYYPSGVSTEEGLTPRKSDADGKFGWEFNVSENSTAKKLKIAVISENSYLITEIEFIS